MPGVLFGLIPAILVSRAELSTAMREGGRGSSDGTGGRRAMHALVTVEVALAVVLTIVVGLFARSFAKLQHVRTGFDSAGAISAQVALPVSRYGRPREIAAY